MMTTILTQVIIAILLVFMFFCIILLYRNELVYKFRTKAIYILHDNDLSFSILESPSYDKMVYSFSKWKFTHFYPGLVKYNNKNKK